MPRLTKKILDSVRPRARPYEIRDSGLKGFLLKVQPSGIASWVIEYGRGRRKTIGRASVFTPEQARQRATKLLGQVADGVDPRQLAAVAKTATLTEFLKEEYGPWFEKSRRSGPHMLKRIKTAFGEEFGSTRLHEISPLRLDRLRSKRLAEGLSKSTLNRDLSALKAALSKAEEWGLIGGNPIAKVKLYSLDSNASVRYLTPEEEKGLKDALVARDGHLAGRRARFNDWRRERGLTTFPEVPVGGFADHLHPITLLALHTGMRRGEIFNLKWSSLDLQKATVEVAGSGAKSGQTRHIPLNEEIQLVLKKWRSQCPESASLVFPGAHGERLDNIATAWASLLTRAGLESFRFHDCRHHFASRLAMEGVALNTVRELMGHSEMAMTLRYAHLAPQHKADAVAKLIAQDREELR